MTLDVLGPSSHLLMLRLVKSYNRMGWCTLCSVVVSFASYCARMPLCWDSHGDILTSLMRVI